MGFRREVSLVPLLGDLHEWPLVVIKACPATSRVVVGGLNTPLIVIDDDSYEPRWLCGASWEKNGLPKLTANFNSARITSVDISQTGVILFTIYSHSVAGEDDESDPRGFYAVDLEGTPHRLRVEEEGKVLRPSMCDFTLYEDNTILMVQPGSPFQR